MVRRARAPQVPERGCGRYGADERADADVECDAPEGMERFGRSGVLPSASG